MKVFLYIRVACADQLAAADQREELERYAKDKGYEVAAAVAADGISGVHTEGIMNFLLNEAKRQGIGTILKARHLVLLAFGEGKAEAVEETCEGGVSAFCPASALQLHPHATIIVDEAAASRLRHKDYYKYAFEHKPAWQGI